MSARLFEREKGSRTWWVRMTVPRGHCVSDRSGDRRSKVKIGPKQIAVAVAEEANGLLAAATLQGVPVRARDLLRQAAIQLRGRHQGASPDPACMAVSDYGPSWLETVSGSTLTQYEGIYRREIVPVFGSLPLNRIPKRLIREWVTAMERRGLASSTWGTYFRGSLPHGNRSPARARFCTVADHSSRPRHESSGHLVGTQKENRPEWIER